MFEKTKQSKKTDQFIELTKEHVKAALSSLMVNRTGETKKRSRDKSRDDKKIRKKSKPIPNENLPVNISSTKTIVLGTSNLTSKQMVRVFFIPNF